MNKPRAETQRIFWRFGITLFKTIHSHSWRHPVLYDTFQNTCKLHLSSRHTHLQTPRVSSCVLKSAAQGPFEKLRPKVPRFVRDGSEMIGI